MLDSTLRESSVLSPLKPHVHEIGFSHSVPHCKSSIPLRWSLRGAPAFLRMKPSTSLHAAISGPAH